MAWRKHKKAAPVEEPATEFEYGDSSSEPECEAVGYPTHIGRSVHIQGELSGDEDVTVAGRIEGKISLADSNLTVGEGDPTVTGDLKHHGGPRVQGHVQAHVVQMIAAGADLRP